MWCWQRAPKRVPIHPHSSYRTNFHEFVNMSRITIALIFLFRPFQFFVCLFFFKWNTYTVSSRFSSIIHTMWDVGITVSSFTQCRELRISYDFIFSTLNYLSKGNCGEISIEIIKAVCYLVTLRHDQRQSYVLWVIDVIVHQPTRKKSFRWILTCAST